MSKAHTQNTTIEKARTIRSEAITHFVLSFIRNHTRDVFGGLVSQKSNFEENLMAYFVVEFENKK